MEINTKNTARLNAAGIGLVVTFSILSAGLYPLICLIYGLATKTDGSSFFKWLLPNSAFTNKQEAAPTKATTTLDSATIPTSRNPEEAIVSPPPRDIVEEATTALQALGEVIIAQNPSISPDAVRSLTDFVKTYSSDPQEKIEWPLIKDNYTRALPTLDPEQHEDYFDQQITFSVMANLSNQIIDYIDHPDHAQDFGYSDLLQATTNKAQSIANSPNTRARP